MSLTTDVRPTVRPIPVPAAMSQKSRRKRSKGLLVLRAVNDGARTSKQISELTGLRQHYVSQCLRFWRERGKIVEDGRAIPTLVLTASGDIALRTDGRPKHEPSRPLTLWRPAKRVVGANLDEPRKVGQGEMTL